MKKAVANTQQSRPKKSFAEILDLVISGSFLLIVLLVILRFIWGPERGLFNADWGDTLLWAEATANSGKLLDPDFNYACFLPFGGNLIMLPGILIFGLSLKAQMVGMSLFLILFTSLLILTLKEATDMPWTRALNGASLVLAVLCVSAKAREMFWGHIIYYSLGCFYLMLLFCAYSLANKDDKIPFIDTRSARDIVKYVLFCLAVVLAAGNGTTIISLASLPILGGCFAVQMMEPNGFTFSPENRKKWFLILTEVLCTIIGILLYLFLTAGMDAPYQNGNSVFSATDTWFNHISILVDSFCQLFGVRTGEDISLFSANGIVILFEAVFMVILWISDIILLIRYRKISGERTKLFLCAGILMEALLLFIWIVGVVNAVYWRLTPLLFLFLAETVVLIWELYRDKISRRWSIVLMIPFVICAVYSLRDTESIDRDIYYHDYSEEVLEYLEENDLRVGYAEYWTAIRAMVYSDDRIQIAPVNFSSGSVAPRLYQSDRDWYRPVDGCERYFLIMTSAEYEEYQGMGAAFLEDAETIERINIDFYVLTYDHYMVAELVEK